MIKNVENAGTLSYDEAVCEVKREIDNALGGSREAIRKYLEHLKASSGKLIRAKALLICALDPGDRVPLNAVKLAAAVEMFHLATLVHDDVIDDAQTRRGKAALHKKFGRKLAVICGDYLFSIALKLISEIRNRESYINVDLPDFVSRVCIGELEQHVNNKNYDLTAYKYLKIISGKTAALFEAAFFGGAIIGGAAPREAEKYMRAGRYVGMVFQLNDDCIDFEESEDTARKTVRSDYEQGVVTLPLIYTISNNPDIKEKITNAPLTASRVAEIVITAGGIDFTRGVAKRYYSKGIKTINQIYMHESKREMLISILEKAFRGIKVEL